MENSNQQQNGKFYSDFDLDQEYLATKIALMCPSYP